MQIVLFGAGYSARAFARATPDPAIRIIGTTRSTGKFDALAQAGIEPVLFDGGLTDAFYEALGAATHLVVSAAPDDAGDPLLAALADKVASMPHLQWIGYLSTVGVYGDHDGDWVDEDAECKPVSRRSILRVEAEKSWLGFADRHGVSLAILRLSGIYGPGRNAFVNLEAGTAKRLIKPGQVFNRIHVADIAGALWHLAEGGHAGIFNVTDDRPAPPQDVVTEAARIMGVEPPPEQAYETAALTPMQRSFYGENKRVSNRRLRDAGYRFAVPDYHAALADLWQADWRGVGTGDARSPIKTEN